MPGIAWKCEAILVVTELVNGKIRLWLKIMLLQNAWKRCKLLNIYFHIHLCAHLEELWWSSKTYMHDVYWYNISIDKPNLYNIICIYISLSLSLWTKPMRLCIIHMIDLLFVCINQKHLQEIFSELTGPGKDQSVKVWSASSCELVWDPHESRKGRTGVGWIWDSMGTTTPAIFWGYPKKWDRNRFTNREIWSTRTKTWVGFCEVPKFKPWGQVIWEKRQPSTGRRLNGPPSTLTMWGVMVVSLSPNFPKFTVNNSFK